MANYETGSGTSRVDGLIGVFMLGWFIGMFTFLIMLIIVDSNNPIEIHSDKILQPEKRLTTDGKTIDTLYIYKQ